MNIDAFRDQFPALKGWTYLDTASFGQVPRCAADAVQKHLLRRDEAASTDFMSWFGDMDRIREKCARLINASPEDIAFVPNASIGLSFLMQGLDWNLNDEVLTFEDEFPNQLYRATRKVKWPEFYDAVNERTRVVLVSSVNYATGFRAPIAEMSRFLHERNIHLYVDGTQSVGALQFDVQEIRPSMMCVDAYKWMVSPNGAGFVYVEPRLRGLLKPDVVGWRSDAGWRAVNALNSGLPSFSTNAERFEGGMLVFPSLYGMESAIDLLLRTGPAEIEAHVMDLANEIRSRLTELGAEVTRENSPIVKARFARRDSNEIAKSLRAKNVIISARYGWLRISPHAYNNDADIDALCTALRC